VSGAKNGADRKSDEQERSGAGAGFFESSGAGAERGATKSGRSHPLTKKVT